MTHSDDSLKAGILQYFSEFGPTACETIYQEIVRRDGVAGVLTKLAIFAPRSSDVQYQLLLEYLRMNGIDDFARRVAPVPSAQQPPATRAESSTAADRRGTGYARVRAKPLPQQAGSGDTKSAKSATSSPAQSPAKSAFASAPKPASKPPATRDPSDTAQRRESSAGLPMPRNDAGYDPIAAEIERGRAAAKARGVSPGGKWDGVTERRNGRDRRCGKDRRSKVATCNPDSNKRFGGERRSGVERRRNWPRAKR